MRNIIYTPVNPSFTIYKWDLSGSKLYRHVFVMDTIDNLFLTHLWCLGKAGFRDCDISWVSSLIFLLSNVNI